MIKAKLDRIDKNTISLTIKGHARATETGQDIICASASILAYTAAQLVTDYNNSGYLEKEPKILMQKGNSTIICTPKEGYLEEVKHTFYVVGVGLNLLAHNYPQYIDFINVV